MHICFINNYEECTNILENSSRTRRYSVLTAMSVQKYVNCCTLYGTFEIFVGKKTLQAYNNAFLLSNQFYSQNYYYCTIALLLISRWLILTA